MPVKLLGRSDALALRQVQSFCIPLFVESVSAGFPSPAQDYVEQTLDLNRLCIKHPAATFFVRAEGDSMIEAGIFPRDILVVDRSLQACHDDVVIACLFGELTVKTIELQPKIRLVAKNPAYAPIEIPEAGELDIFGVVVHVVRNLRSGR